MGTVNAIFPVSTVGTDNNVTPAATNNFAEFEAIVGLENTQSLLNAGPSSGSGSGLSTQVNVGLQDADLLNLSPQALNVLTGINSVETTPSANTTNLTLFQEITEYQNTQDLIGADSSAGGFSIEVNAGVGLNDADLLNLSPAALNVINGVQEGTNVLTSDLYPLTSTQIQQVATILAPYINTPFDPNSLTKILAQLASIGLDPATISLQAVYEAMLFTPAPNTYLNEELITESEIVEDSLAEQLDEA